MNLVIVGGTGSLGRAILRQQDFLKHAGIDRIRVISRDESKQVSVEKNYFGTIPLDCYLGDASDHGRMQFALRDANYVIHAAAQKRIDKFEKDIPQGYRTNILGTHAVAEGFYKSKYAIAGILVSTDKACLPTTAYGVSKLAAEHLFLWYNEFQKRVAFRVCRFGNVFGSRGSVLEAWTEMAINRRPLPVTNIHCTRYFMRMNEAARFVLMNLFYPAKRIAIPTMKSIEMVTVAKVVWKYHNPGQSFEFTVTGMRGNEKLHEVMEGDDSSELAERFTEEELTTMYADWYLNEYRQQAR